MTTTIPFDDQSGKNAKSIGVPTPVSRNITPATPSFSERRRHERYNLPSMYTEVKVRELEDTTFNITGHAYDLSLGGLRFELDTPLEPGAKVAVQLKLPGSTPAERKAIFAFATIVRVHEDDLESLGPVRMACIFDAFCTPDAEKRLRSLLTSGRFGRAA